MWQYIFNATHINTIYIYTYMHIWVHITPTSGPAVACGGSAHVELILVRDLNRKVLEKNTKFCQQHHH